LNQIALNGEKKEMEIINLKDMFFVINLIVKRKEKREKRKLEKY
jgi:hypothetical protein